MKRHLFILSLSALTLFSCGGSQKPNQTSTTENTKPTEIKGTAKTVEKTADEDEPKDSVARIIWELVKDFDSNIKQHFDDANAPDKWYFDNPKEVCTSKTTFEFTFIHHGEESGDSDCGIKLGCYQMPDKSWIAVIVPTCIYEHDHLWTLKYADGKISKVDIKTVFPEGFDLLGNLQSIDYKTFNFDNKTMSAAPAAFWTEKYKWKGSDFRPATTIYAPFTVNMSDGGFYGYKQKYEQTVINVNNENDSYEASKMVKAGVVTDASGKTLAKLDIKNGRVMGYSIVDPLVAVSEEDNYSASSTYMVYHDRALSYPVTLGMPIKDVLNYKKGNKLKDSVITQGEKDGKYVITQQLNHEDFAGDTYIEFSAPDQNSKITGIRVYYEPLTFDFNRDILQSNKLNPLTLAALKAVNLDVSSYGKVNGGMLDTTGFRLYLDGEVFCIEFRTYRDKNGCLVALAKFHGDEYITDDVKYWHFSNGELKETEPAFDSKYSDYYNWAKGDGGMNFDPDGIFFLLSEDDQLFQWNGEKFEPGRRKYSYEEEE